MVKQEHAILNQGEAMVIASPADIMDGTDLDWDEAERLVELVWERASRRSDERTDFIVVLDDWVVDYGITNHTVFLCGDISNYSSESYKMQGSFAVDLTELRSIGSIDDTTVTSVVEFIDKRDTDYHNDPGEMFIMKNAVNEVFAVE